MQIISQYYKCLGITDLNFRILDLKHSYFRSHRFHKSEQLLHLHHGCSSWSTTLCRGLYSGGWPDRGKRDLSCDIFCNSSGFYTSQAKHRASYYKER